jgi:hypothetical protein
MSIGPIIIFDKSTLESLNPDEACWLETFYLTNITPLFYVETLADLKKKVARGRTPEQVVGNLAYKTPPSGKPNVHHKELCIANFLGYPIEMRQVPVLGRGRTVTTGDQTGVMFENAPEMVALQRWQEGEFLQIEYLYASNWRRMLSRLNFTIMGQLVEQLISSKKRLSSLEEAKEIADKLANGERHRFLCLKIACILLNIPEYLMPRIIQRWKADGGQSLREFAGYAAHVFTVDVFFYLAMSANLISNARASHKIDIAYLYYLPFCMVFASNDKLHKSTVPLFLRSEQVFVDGIELKADLAKLDALYSKLPEEVREQGIMRFANEPPLEGEYLTTKLWDQFLPKWRQIAQDRKPRSQEEEAMVLAHMKKITDEADPLSNYVGDPEEGDFMTLSYMMPIRMGKWRILPPGVENQENK